ncbi:hypothetical protein [Hathewaya limosa]|uniref:Trp operon repressor n=1 Tax=Hathewaya limosa TaxID=1536 RepID=A0ABU0JV10_HATLI|nr:hypothetical protein [Hathewaya limosa]MDQ0480943.1 Trp operon repressor [Hathewaya limosa]
MAYLLSPKQQELLHRVDVLKKLREDGLTKKDIAEELKIIIELVTRAYRKIKDNSHIVGGSKRVLLNYRA